MNIISVEFVLFFPLFSPAVKVSIDLYCTVSLISELEENATGEKMNYRMEKSNYKTSMDSKQEWNVYFVYTQNNLRSECCSHEKSLSNRKYKKELLCIKLQTHRGYW